MWLAEGGEPGKCNMMCKETGFFLFLFLTSTNRNGITKRDFQKYFPCGFYSFLLNLLG